jgi:RNA polymerase sigma factor (sigma-70 family)
VSPWRTGDNLPIGVDDDAQLLERWRGGDRGSGELLFDRYYDAVTRFFANKIAENPSDLVQETFTACLQGRDRLRDSQSFRSYLFGIAYNVLRQAYRGRRIAGDRFDPATHSAADASPGPGTMMADTAEQRLLLEGLRRIPLDHQVVLELFYWEDMTSAAIADTLGEPHGTIRTRLRRARELLREAIARMEADAEVLSATQSNLDGWARRLAEADRD